METKYGLFVSGLFHSSLSVGLIGIFLRTVVYFLLLYSIPFMDPFVDAILIP